MPKSRSSSTLCIEVVDYRPAYTTIVLGAPIGFPSAERWLSGRVTRRARRTLRLATPTIVPRSRAWGAVCVDVGEPRAPSRG